MAMSLRKYAKSRGVTPMAVSRAVSTGRLPLSSGLTDKGQPCILDPELADQEWAANTDLSRAPQYVRERAAQRQAGESPATGAPPPPAPPSTPPTVRLPPFPIPDSGESPDLEGDDGRPLDMKTVSLREKYWSAQGAELKYRQLAQELVSVAEVEREITTMVTAARNQLLGLPTRARQALPKLTSADIAVIDRLVREALEELSSEAKQQVRK